MSCHQQAGPSMISKGTVTSYGGFNNDTQNATALRQRVVNLLSPTQLDKWDAEKTKAKEFMGQKITA
jgi:hypothetical protein